MGNVLCGEATPHIDNSDEAQSMGLIPDVFSDSKFVESLGSLNLNIQYGWTSCRAVMRPADVTRVPTVTTSTKLEENALYTLIVVDPDAPSRVKPIYRSYFHQVVIDIPGKQTTPPVLQENESPKFTLNGGRTALEYISPAPPYNSGPHRYIHMLFKQTGFLGNVITGASLDLKAFLNAGPGGLNVEDFVTKYQLGLQAVHIFQASWDDSCDKVHEAIGFLPPDMYKSPAQLKVAKDATAEAENKAAADLAAKKETEEKAAANAAANQVYISDLQKRLSETFTFGTTGTVEAENDTTKSTVTSIEASKET